MQSEQALHSNKYCTLMKFAINTTLIKFLPLLNSKCEWHNGFFSTQKISLEHLICILIFLFKLFQLIRENLERSILIKKWLSKWQRKPCKM